MLRFICMAKTIPNGDATQSITDPYELSPFKKKKSSQLLSYIFSQTERCQEKEMLLTFLNLICLRVMRTLGKLARCILSIPASSGLLE